MMKAKSVLLASVAGTMAAPMANAADMPVKAQPRPTAAPAIAMAPSWAGLYLGVHAGAAWHKAKADSPNTYYSPNLSDTKTGFAGGGLIGYNMQFGSIIAGAEADITGLSAKVKQSEAESCCGGLPGGKYTHESNIDWMATLRARLGVTTGNLLIFVTGGVAWADIDNKLTYRGGGVFGGSTQTWSVSQTKTGPVFGGGFDYMFSPNWIGRVEALWADFGKTSTSKVGGSLPSLHTKTTTFNDSVVIVRGALAYKF
jgi:outer membrane immunogenic protein